MTELARQTLHKRPLQETAQPEMAKLESHARTPMHFDAKSRAVVRVAHCEATIRDTIMHNVGMLVSAQE